MLNFGPRALDWGFAVSPQNQLQGLKCDPKKTIMSNQGSAGNVLAAICSFFIPGLGQLVQGRLMIAIVQFVMALVLWLFLLGWIIHIWSIVDAARYTPDRH
jgi:TM2 domain-containing membrane protein YozV